MSTRSGNGYSINVRVIREPAFVPMTPRKREICLDYGIPPREAPYTIADGLSVRLAPGEILFVGGPSGSGKSSILAEIAAGAGEVVWVGSGRFGAKRPMIDAIAPRRPLAEAMEILTACGLGEPRLWIRPFADLSDGEKFRASLARAIGAAMAGDARVPIICDEFTAILHRRAARAIAYNLRKLVTRHGLILIVATTHDDIVDDLQPDRRLMLGGLEPRLVETTPRHGGFSLRRRAVIETGSVRDYRIFSPMHYRHRDGLGFVDKVFLLRDRTGGDPLGILVFAHAPRELSLRNRATAGRFIRNMRRLNRELRILRRLVMHPDVRGCGLGHWFVRKTLPRVGVRFIECLAVMGAVNPVFERAGMTRIGRCPLPAGRLAMLRRMKELKVDPFAPDFPRRIARCPRVRRLVEKTIMDWVRGLHGSVRYEAQGRPPTELTRAFRQLIGAPPVYYLWDRHGAFPRRETTRERPNGRSEDAPRRRGPRAVDRESGRMLEGRSRHRPDRHPTIRSDARKRRRGTPG